MTDKECQCYIIETSHAGVQEKDGEDLEETVKHTGGHPGINKTQEKVSSRFFWPGIKQDVSEYIMTCDRCQRVKKYALQKTNTVLHNVPVPVKVMSQVGIDLMCLKETDGFEDKRGYKYIITAECYFTKYVELGALKTKTGLEVVTWIYDNIFCHYGITDIHISDKGKEFTNSLAKELFKRCRVCHHITTPYHPQANGMVERMNRTTSEMILKMLKAERKQKDWVNYIPTVAFALRTSKHASTNYEPLLLMIGCKLKLPSEVSEVYPDDVFEIPDLSADEIELLSQHITELKFHEMVKARDDIFDEANENIKKSQQ